MQDGILQIEERIICNNIESVGVLLENDLVSDCGSKADEEYFLKSLAAGNLSSCMNKWKIPCKKRHPKCYNVSQICTYKLNSRNYLTPCRTW